MGNSNKRGQAFLSTHVKKQKITNFLGINIVVLCLHSVNRAQVINVDILSNNPCQHN